MINTTASEPAPPKHPSLSSVGWVLLFTGIPYFAVGFLFQVILAKWLLVLGELALLLPAYVFLRRKGFDVRAALRLNPVSARMIVLSLVLGLAVTVLAMELNVIVESFLPFPEHLENLMKETLIAQNWHDWVILMLASVLLAGLFEEMLFRGFVQHAFEQKHPALFAIFSTAVLFSFVHLLPWWFIQLIFVAMFLGVLAWRSESIIPSAIIHAQNNLISILLINFGEDRLGPWFDWNGHVHPAVLLLALAALAVGLHFFFRFCEEETRIPTLFNTPLA
jgi:membrane protease YdiL (CAAX protease family)